MKKNFLVVATLIVSITLASFTGCGNGNAADTSVANKDTTAPVNSEIDTTVDTTTETTTTEATEETEIATEEVPEEPVIVYAEWIDTLYGQMTGLDFDSVIATISQADFTDNCSIYKTFSVSSAYENECYRLPVSTGGEIGIVKTNYEITIFVCPNDSDEHYDHNGGFEVIGYGDIAVAYSEEGTVTCDGVHVKSTKPGQMSFDMEPGGIWMVWCV